MSKIKWNSTNELRRKLAKWIDPSQVSTQIKFPTRLCAVCGGRTDLVGSAAYSATRPVDIVGDDHLPATFTVDDNEVFCSKEHMIEHLTGGK